MTDTDSYPPIVSLGAGLSTTLSAKTPPPTPPWDTLGTIPYERLPLYSMQWDVADVADFILRAAPDGGPVALLHNPARPVLLGRAARGIRVFTSAGVLLRTLPAEGVADFGWAGDVLVIVSGKGHYACYAGGGAVATAAAAGAFGTPVVDIRCFPGGFAARLSDGSFRLVRFGTGFGGAGGVGGAAFGGFDASGSEAGATGAVGPAIETTLSTADFTGSSAVTAWAVTGSPPHILAASAGSVFRLDGTAHDLGAGADAGPAAGVFTSLAPSPSGHFVALLDATRLRVATADFARVLSDTPLAELDIPGLPGDDTGNMYGNESGPLSFGNGSGGAHSLDAVGTPAGHSVLGVPSSPVALAWSGDNCVALAAAGTVVLAGPFGESVRYFYAGDAALISERDCVRVFSADACEIVRRVPRGLVAVASSEGGAFAPPSLEGDVSLLSGSEPKQTATSADIAPAARLFAAARLFSSHSPNALDTIREIRLELVQAVDDCIGAAADEFAPARQKALLSAAALGKSFLDLYNPNHLIQVSQALRVLNALREYHVGFALTYEGYKAQPPSFFIDRLTAQSQHALAVKICEYLEISPAPVIADWARSKMADEEATDDALCSQIMAKLNTYKDVHPSEVAQMAWKLGRIDLAAQLLEYEVHPSKQVPLMVSMKLDGPALTKAIDSGDPDLVLSVLLHLKRVHSLGDFFQFLDGQPAAIALLQAYARENDRELLRDFFYQDDRRTELACLALQESYFTNITFEDRIAKLKVASKAFGEDKDRAFESRITLDQVKLLHFQDQLEKTTTITTPLFAAHQSIVGLSLNETLRFCIAEGLQKQTEKLRSDFKVPLKRFYYIKMKALVDIRDWDALNTFIRSKKSPIGYEPFVEYIASAGFLTQAAAIVPRCDGRLRADLYVKCQEWVLAAEECSKRNDRAKLNELRQRAPNTVIAAQIDQIADDLQKSSF